MVFTVDPLRDIRDEVEVMLDFGFTLFELIAVLTSFHSLFFDRLFGASDFRSILASDFFELLFLQLGHLIFIIVNIFMDLLLIFNSHALVGIECIFFKAVTDSQLSLKQFNIGTVVTFVVVVAFNAANDLLPHLFICLKLVFVLGHKVTIHSEPLVVFDIIFTSQIFFFHKVDMGCNVRLGFTTYFC